MSDRHEKWVPVEPGHVIPAGQPHREKWTCDFGHTHREIKRTKLDGSVTVPVDTDHSWFVDSSWKPPLDLPTEPTWGIVVLSGSSFEVGQWIESLSIPGTICKRGAVNSHSRPLDFIPLTPEQVARIETAR